MAPEISAALLCLSLPSSTARVVANDALLQLSLRYVTRKLIVYVEGTSECKIMRYMSDLWAAAWDIAVSEHKIGVDVRIAWNSHSTRSLENLLCEDIEMVFGEDSTASIVEAIQKREEHGLSRVSFLSLSKDIAKYLNPILHYAEDACEKLLLHDTVLIGGTFDHLHNGHKKLLSLAVHVCQKRLMVGVTAAHMLRDKHHSTLLESLNERREAVLRYVSFLAPGLQVQIVTIDDAFGPSITFPTQAALIVSSETVGAVEDIQRIRADRGLVPLYIIVTRRTESSILSSSFIRKQLVQQ